MLELLEIPSHRKCGQKVSSLSKSLILAFWKLITTSAINVHIWSKHNNFKWLFVRSQQITFKVVLQVSNIPRNFMFEFWIAQKQAIIFTFIKTMKKKTSTDWWAQNENSKTYYWTKQVTKNDKLKHYTLL